MKLQPSKRIDPTFSKNRLPNLADNVNPEFIVELKQLVGRGQAARLLL